MRVDHARSGRGTFQPHLDEQHNSIQDEENVQHRAVSEHRVILALV